MWYFKRGLHPLNPFSDWIGMYGLSCALDHYLLAYPKDLSRAPSTAFRPLSANLDTNSSFVLRRNANGICRPNLLKHSA